MGAKFQKNSKVVGTPVVPQHICFVFVVICKKMAKRNFDESFLNEAFDENFDNVDTPSKKPKVDKERHKS